MWYVLLRFPYFHVLYCTDLNLKYFLQNITFETIDLFSQKKLIIDCGRPRSAAVNRYLKVILRGRGRGQINPIPGLLQLHSMGLFGMHLNKRRPKL